MKKHKLLSVLILGILCLCLCSCKMESGTNSNAEKVLNAILECPNEELASYGSNNYAGSDIIPSDRESVLAALEAEQAAWKKQVGECFEGDGSFRSFMNQSERTLFLSTAFACSLSISVKEIAAEDRVHENIQYFNAVICITDENASAEDCSTRWRVTYNEEEPELIHQIELMDDGGFWEKYVG